MIAYVFWHRPRPDVAAPDYESALTAFHVSLLAARLRGLRRTTIFRTRGVPWLSSPDGVYEDWHQLEDSAALDELNDAAVTGERKSPHDRVASLVAEGAAGLYSLRLGAPSRRPARTACWLAKPTGMPYAQFFDSLRPLGVEGTTLWGRRMVLGPTPEFCLHAATELALPYPALSCALAPLFDEGPR